MARAKNTPAPPPPPPEKPAGPPDLAKMSKLERLRWLVGCQQAAYIAASAKSSHVAAGQALKELERLLEELAEEEARNGDQQVTEEVYLGQLEQASRDMATQHLEPFVREFLARHPGVKIIRQGAACRHCGKGP